MSASQRPPRARPCKNGAQLMRDGAFYLVVPACALAFAAVATSSTQTQAPAAFTTQCAPCHGTDGLGTAQGPALAMNRRVAEQSAEQLAAYIQRGNPGAGMPS